MKNPFMSAWLSAANKMAGAARGQAMAETRKAQAKMLAEMQKGWMQTMGLGTRKGTTTKRKTRKT